MALKRVHDGASLLSLRNDYPNISWNKAFVARPKDVVDILQVPTEEVKRIAYVKKVFAELLVAHGPDNIKGRTLYSQLGQLVNNVPCTMCKLFTDLCPRCIEGHQRNRPTAGLQPIVTNGFNICGQVDLVDFQIMPDGKFCFLLNYIDHSIKFLFSIPLMHKHASCIALALFKIFTTIGPPMILQSDNGSEFHGAALNAQ